MIKRLFLVVLFSIFSSQGSANGEGVQENGEAYYYDFRIQRITGLHEDEIENYGIRYLINMRDFMWLLVNTIESERDYDHLNIRAKIIFPKKEFFIDYDGNVRSGNAYYKIDRDAFVNILISKSTRNPEISVPSK